MQRRIESGADASPPADHTHQPEDKEELQEGDMDVDMASDEESEESEEEGSDMDWAPTPAKPKGRGRQQPPVRPLAPSGGSMTGSDGSHAEEEDEAVLLAAINAERPASATPARRLTVPVLKEFLLVRPMVPASRPSLCCLGAVFGPAPACLPGGRGLAWLGGQP